MSAPSNVESAVDIKFLQTVPILRIFDESKAREFYCDFLGFKVDWQHRFESGLPMYMQVSRGTLRIHLSEHHGDGSPGAHVFVEMTGIDDFHREVIGKGYKFMKPCLHDEFYGARSMRVIDPFGNRISFNEYNKTNAASKPDNK
jgi:uncharacterized glyoxalase superfamily protein PhnB